MERVNSRKGPSLANMEGAEGRSVTFSDSKSQSQYVPCELVHYHAKSGHTYVLFWGSDFCSRSSIVPEQRLFL